MKLTSVLFALIVFLVSCRSHSLVREQSTAHAKTVCTQPASMQTRAYDSIPGVDPGFLSLDIFGYQTSTRACSGLPVLIYVHGGGWAIGDKARVEYKDDFARNQGYILVSVNYRLSAYPPSRPTGALHPNHVQDVAHAVAWVFKNISQFGGDAQKISLIGHSAGAHLVSLLGVHPQYLSQVGMQREQIRCITSLDTEIYDLAKVYASGSPQQKRMIENAFGTSQSSFEDASPIKWVRANEGLPAFLIVTRGRPERKELAKEFHSILLQAKVSSQLVDATGFSHAEVNKLIGDPNDSSQITAALTQFLATCFMH